jgi:putative peptidoglycan lipid II flippase
MKDKHINFAKSVSLVMIATLFARALGFFREMMIAYKFGTTGISDAFIVSFSIPELLTSGIGSAVATLYIPMYLKIQNENKEHTSSFNTSVSAGLILFALIIVGLMEIFPTEFMSLFASGFDAETLRLAIGLTKIMIFSAIPILLDNHYKAYAQIHNRFAAAIFIGSIINVCVILGLMFVTPDRIMMLAYITLFGNILSAVCLFVLAKKLKFCYAGKIDVKNKYIKGLLIGILPIGFSNIVYEINQIIDKNFASHLVEGTISALNYSSKIINMITAVLGTAVATTVFPRISRLFMEKDEKNMAKELMNVTVCLLAIIIPIAFLVIVFAKQIIGILFGHGNFNDSSLNVTSQCLQFYTIGILGFNLKAVWTRAFNAMLDTKTPAINSFIAVILNVVMNLLLINILQHRGLALSTGVASIFTSLMLIRKFAKINTYFDINKMIKEICIIVISTLVFVPFVIVLIFVSQHSLIAFVVAGVLLIAIASSIYISSLNKLSGIVNVDTLKIAKKFGFRSKLR